MTTSGSVENYYGVLGVANTASAEEIKVAYRAAAKANHPDLGGDPALMLRINEAYAVLKDTSLRADYDRHLAGRTTSDERPEETVTSFDHEPQTEDQRAAFFARIEQVRFAVQNEYEFLRSATLRSLAVHTISLVMGIVAAALLWFTSAQTLSPAYISSITVSAIFICGGLFSLYVLLTETAALLVRPYQYIYDCALLDEHLSYDDKELIGAILADMIDTRRQARKEALRTVLPNAITALKNIFRSPKRT